jgi:hypothetical protein
VTQKRCCRAVKAATVGLVAALVAPGIATAAPALTFTPDTDADAGKPIAASWSSRRVPAHARLVIQRRQGTGGVWRTSKVLRTAGGSTTLGPLPLGRYQIRLAALGARSRVLAQRAKTVRVYGVVPFAKLFGQETKTITTPTFTFEYALQPGGLSTGPSYPEVGVTNPCRRVHADFVPTGEAPSTGILKLLQATRDPVVFETPVETRGAVDGPVVPGKSWSLYSMRGAGSSIQMYINGFAECYSDGNLFDD